MLSLGTIGLFLSQIKRGRRPLASFGWSVLLLAVGLAVGALFVAVAGSAVVPLFGADQLQALPALLLLLAGALLLA